MLNKQSLLATIIISKDDSFGLNSTLRSIEFQKVKPSEVIVVAKGSSCDVDLSSFLIPALRFVTQADVGISAAFNQALSLVGSEWVNFLNGGDSYTHPDVLGTVYPLMGNELDIIAGRARDQSVGNLIPRDIYFDSRRVDQVSHQASFFRRSLFESYGGYSTDFRIRMDFEWMLRACSQARVHWLDEVIVSFEGRGVSSMHPVLSCLEELEALHRHGAPWGRRARLLALYLPLRVARGWTRSLREGNMRKNW